MISTDMQGDRVDREEFVSDLDRLEADLDDVETALACLSRESSDLCHTCRGARDDGSLSARPALMACAEGRLHDGEGSLAVSSDDVPA